MAPTSRPEEKDGPSPRHTTARTSGRPRSSASASNSWTSMSSSKALCLPGLSFVIVATAPSTSSRTCPATCHLVFPAYRLPQPQPGPLPVPAATAGGGRHGTVPVLT